MLLVDHVNAGALDTKFRDHLQGALSNLRIVIIDTDVKIAQVISKIPSKPQTYRTCGVHFESDTTAHCFQPEL